jgi:curved DNA-binding protein CbpA
MMMMTMHSIRETKLEVKKAKRKDFYKILGVTQSANDAEIKKAYKKLALKFHPDRHASKTEEERAQAEASFKDIGEAYAILSDPQKRQRYDSGVDLEDLESDFGGGGGMGGMGVDPSQIFQVRRRVPRALGIRQPVLISCARVRRCSSAAAWAAWAAAWAAWVAAWVAAWAATDMAAGTARAAIGTISARAACVRDGGVHITKMETARRRVSQEHWPLARP